MKTHHLTSLFDRLHDRLAQPGLPPAASEAVFRKCLRWQGLRAAYQEDVGTDRLNPQARLMKYMLIARCCEARLEWSSIEDAYIEALIEINENAYYVVRFSRHTGRVSACRYGFTGTGFVGERTVEGLARIIRCVKREVRPC